MVPTRRSHICRRRPHLGWNTSQRGRGQEDLPQEDRQRCARRCAGSGHNTGVRGSRHRTTGAVCRVLGLLQAAATSTQTAREVVIELAQAAAARQLQLDGWSAPFFRVPGVDNRRLDPKPTESTIGGAGTPVLACPPPACVFQARPGSGQSISADPRRSRPPKRTPRTKNTKRSSTLARRNADCLQTCFWVCPPPQGHSRY